MKRQCFHRFSPLTTETHREFRPELSGRERWDLGLHHHGHHVPVQQVRNPTSRRLQRRTHRHMGFLDSRHSQDHPGSRPSGLQPFLVQIRPEGGLRFHRQHSDALGCVEWRMRLEISVSVAGIESPVSPQTRKRDFGDSHASRGRCCDPQDLARIALDFRWRRRVLYVHNSQISATRRRGIWSYGLYYTVQTTYNT